MSRLARLAEKRDAVDLDEAHRGQGAREGESRGEKRQETPHDAVLEDRRLQGGLEGQPLRDESVQGRQRRDGERADQEIERGPRHAADEASHVVQVAQARGVKDRARSEKKEPLEHGVVERVVERGDQGKHAGCRVAETDEHHGHPQAEQDDADVLDRVVGEQALQVVLHEGVQHAEQRGGGADREHQQAPFPAHASDQVINHPHHAVDRGLDHDAAHQR